MSREVTRVAAREAAHGAFVCGRFWALMEDDEEEDAPDPLPDEVLETPSPSTMAEAFRTTRDLHGKQRKGRKVRMAEIGERLDRVCSRGAVQKKPVATFVGVGGVGLGCFVAEHTKESKSSDKKAAIALIKIKDHQEEEITKEMVEHGLAHTYPWRWVWKARGVATGAFLVAFQSAAKIEKDAIYDWVPLRKINIMVNVKLWTDESLAAGEMTTVWVTAKGVPKTLKNFHGLCEVGSTLGQFIEADMQLLKSSGQVRLKVGVLDHLRIPGWTKLSTPSLHFYKIYFQLEEVVELGWARSEEDMLQDFEDIMDSQPEVNSERDPKRQKNSENAPPTPTGDSIRGGKEIVASTRTLLALEQREKDLMEQDEADAMLSKKLAEQRKHQLDANQIKKKRQDDDGEDSFVSDRYDKDLGYSDADMLNLS
ncbi:hypothetical protein ACQ4PT_023975 [Festuca glaucescens]